MMPAFVVTGAHRGMAAAALSLKLDGMRRPHFLSSLQRCAG